MIWLSNFNGEMEYGRCQACSEVEKENMQSFFRRYTRSEKSFLDSTTPTLNDWETELHLSFLRVYSTTEKPLLPLGKHDALAPTRMSFRFSGDFCDRYWTCYSLEHGSSSCEPTTLGECLHPSTDCGIRGSLKLQKLDEKLGYAARRTKRENPNKEGQSPTSVSA